MKKDFIHTSTGSESGIIHLKNEIIFYTGNQSSNYCIEYVNGNYIGAIVKDKSINTIEKLVEYYQSINKISIDFNKPIEVNKTVFKSAKQDLKGVVAFLEKNGKYYIKVWLMKYLFLVKQLVNDNQLNSSK